MAFTRTPWPSPNRSELSTILRLGQRTDEDRLLAQQIVCGAVRRILAKDTVREGDVILWEFVERVEDLEPGSIEVSVVPRRDRQSVAARRCGDVAVLDGHTLTRLLEQFFLLRPHLRHR